MPRDYKLYLEDIIEAIDKIEKYYPQNISLNLKEDSKTLDAIVKNLEIIGEASSKVPQNIKDLASNIEWKKLSGLRNILVHEYFGIDVEIVEDIVRNKIPLLKNNIQDILLAE